MPDTPSLHVSPSTVLIYFDQEASVERLTRLALSIAARNSNPSTVKLIGSHATPVMSFSGGIADVLSGGLAAQYAEAQRGIAEHIQKLFVDNVGDTGFETEWHGLADHPSGEVAALRELARTADLVIMPQPGENELGRFVENAFREVVTGAGRPVLVVPHSGKHESVGSNLLIGWSPTREATRAVYDALSIARENVRATFMWVAHGGGRHREVELSARAMSAALARHGVISEVSSWTKAEIAIGDVLLNVSFERGADLIVTGAYGHSRFYDAVVGATTSHLLEHMTVPVLFSN